jgi:quinol monooxygenase YgiN
MDSNDKYFLKISGSIDSSKQKEFRQSVRFIFNLIPSGCLGYNLSLDVNKAGLYHLYSVWSSENALKGFEESNEYEVLKGAFEVLGSGKNIMRGRKSDIQLFAISNQDINLYQS